MDVQPNTDNLAPVHRRQQIVLVDEPAPGDIHDPDLPVFDQTKRRGGDQMLGVVSQRARQADAVHNLEEAPCRPISHSIFAIEELRAEGKLNKAGGDISFLFIVGEEKGGPGMLAANLMGLEWEAGIFGEPTDGKLAKGHKWHVVFEVVAKGISCHSGYPHLGKNATVALLHRVEKDTILWRHLQKRFVA
ncbi:hypothetical protein INS49_014350 [Diaporthe citri]|uniref:uncharacterized protein n=1 Tax=Diaporthe citri TaxID=83186 RepID=UPI001C7F05EB|nr:uncharacterized protein INS49_014350 [Diaporthe citri]KAG6358466.1 hypothetical protein INS49_014350 [Diaporthe citri]